MIIIKQFKYDVYCSVYEKILYYSLTLTKYRINKDINVKIKDADGNYSIDIELIVDRVVFLLLYYYQFIYYQHLIQYLYYNFHQHL